MIYRISKRDKSLKGTIFLTASKSESNRVLIIRALSSQPFEINHLASAHDTRTLQNIISAVVSSLSFGEGRGEVNGTAYNVGPAGTAMRFLTAYFSTTEGEHILTGSE